MKAKAVSLPYVTLIAVACSKMICFGPFVYYTDTQFQRKLFHAEGIHILWIDAELVLSSEFIFIRSVIVILLCRFYNLKFLHFF